MRRFYTVLSILFISLIGAIVLNPTTVLAQTSPGNSTNSSGPTVSHQAASITAPGNDFTGAMSSIGTGTSDTGVLAKIMTVIMSLFAWLLGAAMVLLDDVVFYTVFTMGNYISHLSAIGVAWRILRDIGNMVLIFGFLAIGIGVILDTNFYGSGTKMLPTLFIVAIFLNFSLFISEAIIDAGNLFASEIYTQINDGQAPTPLSFSWSANSVQDEGISNKIMSQLGLQTLYGDALNTNISDNGSPTNTLFTGSNILIIGFLGCILFIVAAFVMFSLAFILLTRFVVLIFLIIVAPVGFAGLAVPKLQVTAKKWWNTLFEQAIAAPILLLLLYVALAVITDADFVTGLNPNPSNNAWTGSLNSGDLASFGSILLSFLIAMGLLLFVTRAAKEMSVIGASAATKYAGALSFGAAAYTTSLGWNAFGRGGRFAVQNSPLKNTRAGRLATRTVFRPAENARADLRRIPGVAGTLKFGGAGDAAKPMEKSIKERYEKFKKDDEEDKKRYAKEIAVPPIKTIDKETSIALQDGNYSNVSRILSSVSDTDLESESWAKVLANNPVAASLLPQARFDKLQTSTNLSAAQKALLSAARTNGNDPSHKDSRFNMTITYGPTLSNGNPHPLSGKTRGEALIQSMSTSERGKLSGNILTQTTVLPGSPAGTPPTTIERKNVLDLLNGADFNAIAREGTLKGDQLKAVSAYLNSNLGSTGFIPRGAAASPNLASIKAAAANPAFKAYFSIA